MCVCMCYRASSPFKASSYIYNVGSVFTKKEHHYRSSNFVVYFSKNYNFSLQFFFPHYYFQLLQVDLPVSFCRLFFFHQAVLSFLPFPLSLSGSEVWKDYTRNTHHLHKMYLIKGGNRSASVWIQIKQQILDFFFFFPIPLSAVVRLFDECCISLSKCCSQLVYNETDHKKQIHLIFHRVLLQ